MKLVGKNIKYVDFNGCGQILSCCFKYVVTGDSIDIFPEDGPSIHIVPALCEPPLEMDAAIAILEEAKACLCFGAPVMTTPEEPEPKQITSVSFDLCPVGAEETLGGDTGDIFDKADLWDIIEALNSTFEDGTIISDTDIMETVEVDLKGIDGEGFHMGTNAKCVATTCQAAYQNNSGWTDLDPGGGRKDCGSFDALFVENGSVVTVTVKICKA